MTAEFTCHPGQHLADRFGGAGRRRDDGHACGTGPAQVAMRHVKDFLINRIRVDGRRHTAFNAVFLIHEFENGRQASCRARRAGNNMIRCRIVRFFIDAHNESYVINSGGRRNNNFLHRSA